MSKRDGSVFDNLVRSWDQWAGSGRGWRVVRCWECHEPALGGWTLSELRAPVQSDETDAMQAALVGLAQRGDTAAATTLTVQLRPGLSRLVRLALSADNGIRSRDEAEAEVLSVFGETLMGHPLARRPTKIAANLLYDTRQRLWRAGGSGAQATAHQDDLEAAAIEAMGPAAPCSTEAVADELDLMAAVGTALERLAGTDASRRLTAELAYRAWVLDEASTTIGPALGLGSRAVSTRLCRLRSAVRQARTGATSDGSPAPLPVSMPAAGR